MNATSATQHLLAQSAHQLPSQPTTRNSIFLHHRTSTNTRPLHERRDGARWVGRLGRGRVGGASSKSGIFSRGLEGGGLRLTGAISPGFLTPGAPPLLDHCYHYSDLRIGGAGRPIQGGAALKSSQAQQRGTADWGRRGGPGGPGARDHRGQAHPLPPGQVSTVSATRTATEVLWMVRPPCGPALRRRRRGLRRGRVRVGVRCRRSPPPVKSWGRLR